MGRAAARPYRFMDLCIYRFTTKIYRSSSEDYIFIAPEDLKVEWVYTIPMNLKIDLHCHSNYSDGLLSPQELVKRAITDDIRVLALTDHDTVDGLDELQKHAVNQDIKIINGIELSVRWKKYDIHILGLGVNPYDESLTEIITLQRNKRIERALRIGVLLQDCGVKDAYAKACEIAGHERVGRLHFAKVLVELGFAPDLKLSFKRFLGDRQKAYVPTSWCSLEAAVQSIIKSGGQAVIAHPLKYKLTRTKLHELINDFKSVGGVGLEVVSGDMAIADIHLLARMCVLFDLKASSGSDYHGDGLSRVALGQQQMLPDYCTPIWQQWSIS